MSVWKTACYRDDPLQWYLRSSFKASDGSQFVHSLCDFEIGNFGDFPVPEGVFPGKFRNCVEADPEVLRRVQANDAFKPSHALTALAKEMGPVISGIKAVYYVAAYILKRVDSADKKSFADKAFIEHLVKYGFCSK